LASKLTGFEDVLSDQQRQECNRQLEKLARHRELVERWGRTGQDVAEPLRQIDHFAERLNCYKREMWPNLP